MPMHYDVKPNSVWRHTASSRGRGGEKKKTPFMLVLTHVHQRNKRNVWHSNADQKVWSKQRFSQSNGSDWVCLCWDEQKACWLDSAGALPWIFRAFAGLFSWRERSDLRAMVQLPLHLRQKSRNKKGKTLGTVAAFTDLLKVTTTRSRNHCYTIQGQFCGVFYKLPSFFFFF